ncbi:Spy/CpxP family protein refolding chaperone [Wenzhouxiangella marina]|uniref:Uncharacterized protein n=1 Tax=Wenzhouxiangella marina TaxID=1579979 RepID=A0A0K0XSC7_9GAMM|nr:Spy/CpxP family protein refolding chaperone [Wenzhouxiangella marina]AKS40588.1 hypothetical protein WM2015_199 [Wenzhouxiangella marina]MBB6088356.1 Spy/CpxP family protein refolding chaperone [Wenzhouxiangella marina]
MNTVFPILRTAIIGLAIATLSVPMAFAQADPSRHLERMSQELQLSDQQRADIEALIEAHRSRMDELGLDPETRREGRAERHALMQEIREVLTPEQQAQWAAGREERQRHRQERGGRRGFLRAMEGLDLSADQRQAIEALIEAQRGQEHAQRQAFMDEVRAILTPEQWDAFQARRESHRANRGRNGG